MMRKTKYILAVCLMILIISSIGSCSSVKGYYQYVVNLETKILRENSNVQTAVVLYDDSDFNFLQKELRILITFKNNQWMVLHDVTETQGRIKIVSINGYDLRYSERKIGNNDAVPILSGSAVCSEIITGRRLRLHEIIQNFDKMAAYFDNLEYITSREFLYKSVDWFWSDEANLKKYIVGNKERIIFRTPSWEYVVAAYQPYAEVKERWRQKLQKSDVGVSRNFAQTESDFKNYEKGTVVAHEGQNTSVVILAQIREVPITDIGEREFSMKQLSAITIPDGVTSIGKRAFAVNLLTSVAIPRSVTFIGEGAFAFNHLTNVTIPDGVTSVSHSAFDKNLLTSVTMPNGVTSIGDWSFAFNQLTSVIIPDSVTSIGENAFAFNQLTSVNIPNCVTSVGQSAFKKNKLIFITIPGSVISIGDWAFAKNQLTSITIPDSVTSIGKGSFTENQLTSVIMFAGVTSIGEVAFARNQLTSVIIPDSITSIGKEAFAYNRLTSVTIPGGLKSISNFAFYQNQLTSVNIPDNITSIGYKAFAENQLTSVTIPGSVTIIGEKAFSENELSSVTIGDNVLLAVRSHSTYIGRKIIIGDEPSFDGGFDNFYNGNGKKAGVYTYNENRWSYSTKY
jgi:hypothetical protein